MRLLLAAAFAALSLCASGCYRQMYAPPSYGYPSGMGAYPTATPGPVYVPDGQYNGAPPGGGLQPQPNYSQPGYQQPNFGGGSAPNYNPPSAAGPSAGRPSPLYQDPYSQTRAPQNPETQGGSPLGYNTDPGLLQQAAGEFQSTIPRPVPDAFSQPMSAEPISAEPTPMSVDFDTRTDATLKKFPLPVAPAH